MRVPVAVLCAHVLMASSAVAEELGPDRLGHSWSANCLPTLALTVLQAWAA